MNRQTVSQSQALQQKSAMTQSRLLQRKCACGNHKADGGVCNECSKKSRLSLQTKLQVNEPGDIYEQEADRVADKVLAMPPGSVVNGLPLYIQRYSAQSAGQAVAAPDSVEQVLASSGRPLDPVLRQDMGRRFGHDFSRVRVHSNAAAEESTQDLNANAYTVGYHIVFGAGRFAPGTPEGRRLLAHELTHVVQQTCEHPRPFTSQGKSIQRLPVLAEGVIADAKGACAVDAGRTATQMAPVQAPGPTYVPVAGVLQAQPGPKKNRNWEPDVEAETRATRVKVGEKLPLRFKVANERTAPRGTTFDWRGIRLNESEAVSMVGFSDHVGAHATLVVKGRMAGIAEVGTTVCFKMPGAQEDYEYTPRVRVEVGPAMASAGAELAQIEKLHAEGKAVSPSRESAAQQEAVAAAQQALGREAHAAGTEINLIVTKVQADISKIENACYRGYQDALTHLNLTQLDEKEQAGEMKSFALSLAGNLMWALSGLIAITPVGLEATIATGLLAKYGPQVGEKMAVKLVPLLIEMQTVSKARLATAVGVGGAMLAQFANGLPSPGGAGGNVSGTLIQLQQKLNTLNSVVFNALSRDLYSTLLRLLEFVPPDLDVDAQQYAGRLETGIRRLLFAGYYENGGATGNQIDPAVIQTDARNQLLRRLVVTSGKISGNGITSTKLEERDIGKMIEPAVSLLGGVKALELGDYELVVEQLHRAVRELGLKGLPTVNADQLRKDFAESDKIVLSARIADGGVEISNRARAMVLDQQLEFDPVGVNPWVTEVISIEIRKKDLTSAKIGKGGVLAYSSAKFWIRARGYLGAQHMEDEHAQIQRGPVMLWLIYKI